MLLLSWMHQVLNVGNGFTLNSYLCVTSEHCIYTCGVTAYVFRDTKECVH